MHGPRVSAQSDWTTRLSIQEGHFVEPLGYQCGGTRPASKHRSIRQETTRRAGQQETLKKGLPGFTLRSYQRDIILNDTDSTTELGLTPGEFTRGGVSRPELITLYAFCCGCPWYDFSKHDHVFFASSRF